MCDSMLKIGAFPWIKYSLRLSTSNIPIPSDRPPRIIAKQRNVSILC